MEMLLYVLDIEAALAIASTGIRGLGGPKPVNSSMLALA
jgi:hypothetical protein